LWRGEGCWSSGTYGYDGAGNITTIGEDTYRYDLVGRITRGTVMMPDGSTRTQSYAYDSFGNIVNRTTDGFDVATSVDPATNRPQSGFFGSYMWDAAGAMTFNASSGESYEWDGMGMMTRRSGTRNLTFLYTADDERIAVFENDPSGNPLRTTWTLRGLDHKVLRSWTSTGGAYATDDWEWKQDYVYRDGGRLLATVTPDGVRHFHLDHLGTPRVITDPQGVKLAEHTYFPFGLEATDERQNAEVMKFTGHERDLDPHSIHDLDYMHARYYTPVMGRFLTVDPARESVNTSAPQSWNRYTYVHNNPLNAIDPDGRITLTLNRTGTRWTGYNDPTYIIRFETLGYKLNPVKAFAGKQAAGQYRHPLTVILKGAEKASEALRGKPVATERPEFFTGLRGSYRHAQFEKAISKNFAKLIQDSATARELGYRSSEYNEKSLALLKEAVTQAIDEYVVENSLNHEDEARLRQAYDIDRLVTGVQLY
jgi:RHS repeat-associated protein